MAEHREELVFTAIRGNEFFDSRANESPWPVAPRDEWIGAYEAAGVRELPSVEPIAGGEWP